MIADLISVHLWAGYGLLPDSFQHRTLQSMPPEITGSMPSQAANSQAMFSREIRS